MQTPPPMSPQTVPPQLSAQWIPPLQNRPPTLDDRTEKEYEGLSFEYKQNHAWHYYGYPGLAEWMASSNDAFILRRYSKTAARTLLYLQHEIGKREKALDDWDAYSMKHVPYEGGCNSFEYEKFPERTELIKELRPLLKEYYELANAFASIKSKPTARPHHLDNLHNWFFSYRNAIEKTEQHFLDDKDKPIDGDLFPVVARPYNPLKWCLHKSRTLRSLFPLKDRHGRTNSPLTRYFSDTGFDNMTCALTVLFGLGFIFAPMWWLHYVQDVKAMLAIITGFVTVFAFWLWMAAGPRQFEILLGTAAYSAVLYVYLQAAHSNINPLNGHA